MKDRLTEDQSARLIELGVDPTKASDFYSKIVFTELGDQYDVVPIFTIADVINLLPKRISKNDACLTIIADYKDWWVGYEYDSALSGRIDSVAGYPAPELIDALFALLVWIIEQKYIKL